MTPNLSNLWAGLAELVERYSRFVISSHINPDGDAVGSAIALRRILQAKDKDAYCLFADEPPASLRPFYRSDELRVAGRDGVDLSDREVVLMVDAGHWERLGVVGEWFGAHPGMKICVDHHPPVGEFPGLRIVDTTSPSTSLMLYRFLRFLSIELTHEIAEPIYLGLMVDTINFHLPNTTVEAHHAAAECLRAGVEPDRVHEPVFGTLSFSRMRLMAEAFAQAEAALNGAVGVIAATQEMFARTGAENGDDEGFSDYSRRIEGVRIGVYLREMPDGVVKVSWRCKDGFEVMSAAQRFGGGGHLRAAGARLRGGVEAVKKLVLEDLAERLASAESPEKQ